MERILATVEGTDPPQLVYVRATTDGKLSIADGTDATGVTAPTGGVGIRGWLSGIFAKLPTLISNRVPTLSSVPTVTSGTILALTTNATGTTYTAFANQACTALDIVNGTGTPIEYRRGGTGVAMQIPAGAARMVIGITNANQVDVRRTDTSNTTVALQAEAFVV